MKIARNIFSFLNCVSCLFVYTTELAILLLLLLYCEQLTSTASLKYKITKKKVLVF